MLDELPDFWQEEYLFYIYCFGDGFCAEGCGFGGGGLGVEKEYGLALYSAKSAAVSAEGLASDCNPVLLQQGQKLF